MERTSFYQSSSLWFRRQHFSFFYNQFYIYLFFWTDRYYAGRRSSVNYWNLYRATIKPLSTNQILPMIADFPSSTERSCSIPESSRWYETTRTNGGSWTDNTASIVWDGFNNIRYNFWNRRYRSRIFGMGIRRID